MPEAKSLSDAIKQLGLLSSVRGGHASIQGLPHRLERFESRSRRELERPMATQTLAARVDRLEQRVTLLEELPTRVDALALQISLLRDEMGSEFSAVRGGIHSGDENTCRTLRDAIRAGDEETRRTLREEIRAGDEETRRTLREEIRASDEETRRTVREEIRAGDERVMEQARVLHEDIVSRLTLILEGGRGSSPRRKR